MHTTDPPELVDATTFLGMNSRDEAVRVACKNFFVDRFTAVVGMSDDQAGVCDRVIWRLPRADQDSYYPFMDRLRTDMTLASLAYDEGDVVRALGDERLQALDMPRRLTLAMASTRGAVLTSVDEALHALNRALPPERRLPVRPPAQDPVERSFPDPELERWYRTSLLVRL